MKTLLLFLGLMAVSTFTLTAQIKNTQVDIKKTILVNPKINQGIKIPNLKNLTTDALSELKVPKIIYSQEQMTARAQKHWELTPMIPKSGDLYIRNFYGFFDYQFWKLISMPIMGYQGPRHLPGWLYLDFKPKAGKEYRMKIFLKDYRNGPNQSLYVETGDLLGQYPIDRNHIVSVVWTIDPEDNCPGCINIGQIAIPIHNTEGKFPDTSIYKIFIDEL
jgi:hypothetical protein